MIYSLYTLLYHASYYFFFVSSKMMIINLKFRCDLMTSLHYPSQLNFKLKKPPIKKKVTVLDQLLRSAKQAANKAIASKDSKALAVSKEPKTPVSEEPKAPALTNNCEKPHLSPFPMLLALKAQVLLRSPPPPPLETPIRTFSLLHLANRTSPQPQQRDATSSRTAKKRSFLENSGSKTYHDKIENDSDKQCDNNSPTPKENSLNFTFL